MIDRGTSKLQSLANSALKTHSPDRILNIIPIPIPRPFLSLRVSRPLHLLYPLIPST